MEINTLTLKETREHWTEWFVVRIQKAKLAVYKKEGYVSPRFYLPVRWRLSDGTLEMWVFPLAPFVWIFYVISNVLRTISRDMVELIQMLEIKYKK